MLLSGLATQMTIPPNVKHAEWILYAQKSVMKLVWLSGQKRSEVEIKKPQKSMSLTKKFAFLSVKFAFCAVKSI